MAIRFADWTPSLWLRWFHLIDDPDDVNRRVVWVEPNFSLELEQLLLPLVPGSLLMRFHSFDIGEPCLAEAALEREVVFYFFFYCCRGF